MKGEISMNQEDIDLGLREVRKAAGYTSEQLGQEVEMNPTYITRVENGTIKNPSFSTIMRLADIISKSSKIVTGEVNLSEYHGLFPKLVMVLKDQNTLNQTYTQNRTLTKMKTLYENADILTEAEYLVISNYAKYKKHIISVETNIEQFNQEYIKAGIARKYEAMDKFDFVTFIQLMSESMNDNDKNGLNEATRNLFTMEGLDPKTKFMDVLIGQMQSFIKQYEDIRLTAEIAKYLPASDSKILNNKQV